MLSKRGAKIAASQDIPWRFAPGWYNPYDAVSNPTGVISFALAENNLMHRELHDYVRQNVTIPASAYTYRDGILGGTRFSVALAAHLNEYFRPHVPVVPGDVITAQGLTSILQLLGYSLADPGDGILVSRPVYGRFELDFGNTSAVQVVYVDYTEGVSPFSPDIVQHYQERLDASNANGVLIKAVLIVNPNNPTGHNYDPATLRSIMAFCERNKIHLISDEVYGLSTYDMGDGKDVPFTSVLSLDTTGLISAERLHVLYGMSKDFAAAGLRLGSLVTRNALLRKAVGANMRFHNPSGVAVAIGSAILEDREFVASFMQLSRDRLRQSRQYTTQQLDEAGIRYEGGNAGFFVYIDLEPWLEPVEGNENPEFVLAQKLLDGGIGFHPCEEHAGRPGQFRLVFSQDEKTLEEGLKRLFATLRSIKDS